MDQRFFSVLYVWKHLIALVVDALVTIGEVSDKMLRISLFHAARLIMLGYVTPHHFVVNYIGGIFFPSSAA